MKTLKLTCFLLPMLLSAYAQNHRATDKQAAKFVTYFNAGQADSLYAICADVIKDKISQSTMGLLVYQFKNGYGNLVKERYRGTSGGYSSYLITFEKPGVGLGIAFDSSNKLSGIFKEEIPETETPGSVTVKSGNATLKGTLSVPQTNQPVPVVLLIAGSGPTDRDGNSALLSQKINNLLMISNELKLKNIAVLRYDKRGTGTSSSGGAYPTFNDEVNDAEAMVKYLKTDKRFSKVIIAGHSEGVLIGALVAQRQPVDAFISLAGAGFAVDAGLKRQLKPQLAPADYQRASLIIDSIKAGNFPHQKMEGTFALFFAPVLNNYLHEWMQYYPAKVIAQLHIPVLLIQGTQDAQISVEDAQALKKAYPKAQLKLIPGMSHLLKDTPAMGADQPLHPQLVPVLTEFINGK